MTTIDHRAEALRLLTQAQGLSHMAIDRANLTAEAQVHATLAATAPRTDNATLQLIAQLRAQTTAGRELLAAARALLDHAEGEDRSTLVRGEDVDALDRRVREATEAGL